MTAFATFGLARGATAWEFFFRGVFEPSAASSGIDTSTTGWTFQIEWDDGGLTAFTPDSFTYDSDERLFNVTVPVNAVCTAPADFETGRIVATKTGAVPTAPIRLSWNYNRFRGTPTTVTGTSVVLPGITLTPGMKVYPIRGGGVNQGARLVSATNTLEAEIVGLNNTDSVLEVQTRDPALAPLSAQASDVASVTTAVLAAIAALNDLSSADVTAAVPTTAQIEAALLNEGDGQALLQAIVDRINSDLDLPALELTAIADAIRPDITAARDAVIARGDVAWVTGGGAAAPTVVQIRQEIDDNSTQLAALLASVGANLETLVTAIQTSVTGVDGTATAIRAIVDRFTFATGDAVNTNIARVNDVGINGSGTTADPFGPA